VEELNNRWFNSRPIHAELSPVTDFREACCRQYEMGSAFLTCFYTSFVQFLPRDAVHSAASAVAHIYLTFLPYDSPPS